jgi:hypothetical protein
MFLVVCTQYLFDQTVAYYILFIQFYMADPINVSENARGGSQTTALIPR